MKKIRAFVDKYLISETACMLTLLGALAYDMYYVFLVDPFTHTLTHNGWLHFEMHLVFGALNTVALVLNYMLFYKKSNTKSRTGYLFMFLGAVGLLMSALTVETSIMYKKIIHWTGSLIFVGTMLAALLFAAIKSSETNKKYIGLTACYLAVSIGDVFVLIFYNGYALFEFLPLVFNMAFLFVANFTKPFSLEKPPSEEAKFVDKFSR